jgi:hypothetical protein
MAGAPLGNRNAAKAKLWAAAIQRALEKRGGGDKIKALDVLAEKLLANCDEGDLAALKELGDRLDGKPAQSIVGEEENPLSIIHRIERVIVDPK